MVFILVDIFNGEEWKFLNFQRSKMDLRRLKINVCSYRDKRKGFSHP